MKASSIHIVYTGGTIGMVRSEDGLKPSADTLQDCACKWLAQHWPELNIQWHHRQPLQDSSQASLADWQRLGEDLLGLIKTGQPIVVLHGTDTLAYASSLLSMILPATHPTVVLTGSQRPWQDRESDAPENLKLAVESALSAASNTVYLAFNRSLFMGSHVTKLNALTANAFVAPQGIQRMQPPPKNNLSGLRNCYPKQIEVITCYPGTRYEGLRAVLATQPDILIMRTLGNGNVPNAAEFAKCFLTTKPPILVNVSQSLIATPTLNQYAVNHALKALPWLTSATMTFEALFCKLHLIHPEWTDLTVINDFMNTPIDHELPASLPWS